MTNTGYEQDEEKPKIPLPDSVSWTVELDHVARSLDDPYTMYCTLQIDGKVMGMIRLPNAEYLEYLRNKLVQP